MNPIITIEGVQVHVEGTGAETIVMVHGWPDTFRLWDSEVALLKDRYRCVRFTLPGFDPAHERRARTLDELTGFLKQVIDQVSPGRKVILMLHDWGCVFGYAFYVRFPQAVSRIVGVDIGDKVSLAQSLSLIEKLMVLAYQGILGLAWMIGGRLGDGITRFMAGRLHCPSDSALIHSGMTYPYYMMWFAGAQSYRRQTQAFKPSCPMLFIYGRRKPLMFHARSWTDELLKQPGNQVVEFDTGHWVMSAQPERFNQVVSDWLSSAPS